MQQNSHASSFLLSLLAVVAPAILQALQGAGNTTLAAIGAAVAAVFTASRAVVDAVHVAKTPVAAPAAPLGETPASAPASTAQK